MTDYLLVHGGAHGAWCWERLIPHLKCDQRVRKVVAVDLIGHGARVSEKDQDQITVEDYIQDLIKAIRDGNMQDVVLVGHSLAGTLIPYAAIRMPTRLKRLVFLSAIIPDEGQNSMETLKNFGQPEFVPEEMEENLRRMFCNDLDETSAQWLFSNLGPEPVAGLVTPVTRKGFPRNIPTTYIVLTKDQALLPEWQRKVLRNLDNPEVIELDSGHDAMISCPKELAGMLLKYA
jgi:pimeloyl-ACP methyl ester carboxylesterase